MIKLTAASTALAACFIFIQTTWLKNGLVLGIVPDFALVIVLWVSYSNKASQGIFAAFFIGLACDLMSASPLGYFAFVYLVPAYAAAVLKQAIHMDRLFVPVLLGAAGTILKAVATGILIIVFGSDKVDSYSLTDYHLWLEVAFNAAISPLMCLLLERLRPLLVAKRVTE